MKNSVLAGLLTGLLTIATYYLIYSSSKEAMLSPLVYLGTGIFYLIAMLAVSLIWKNSHQGIISFKKAVQLGFVCFLVANLFYHGFNYYLFSNDPELVQIQEKMMTQFVGEEAAESVSNEPYEVGIWQVVSQYAYKSIFGFLIALLIGLVIKQEK